MKLFTKNATLAILAASLTTALCSCTPTNQTEKETTDKDVKAINTSDTDSKTDQISKVVQHMEKPVKGDISKPKVPSHQAIKTPTTPLKTTTYKWHTIYADAVKESKERNLPILIDFTGSDWCGWCKKLDKEVFEKPEWKQWSSKNLVLFKADFPRHKKLPAAEEKVNNELKTKYDIPGFPTLILTNATGKKIGELGYQKGGPVNYIKTVKETLNPTPIPKAPNAAGWYINLEEAKRLATIQNKDILLTVTGKGFGESEEKFSNDLMANSEFLKEIKGKYILLHAELIRNGTQSLTLRKQNFGFISKYTLTKIPSVFIINAKGEKVKHINSFATNAVDFVKDMKSIFAGGSAAVPVIKSTGVKTGKDENGWYVNYEEALKVAKEKNIPLLVDFSGSDWCGWCIKLDKEVFNTPVFKKYVEDGHIVKLMIDSPRKTRLAIPLKKQNDTIKSIYEVKGFPTVLLLDGDGKLQAKTGYLPGGPVKYIEMIKQMLTHK